MSGRLGQFGVRNTGPVWCQEDWASLVSGRLGQFGVEKTGPVWWVHWTISMSSEQSVDSVVSEWVLLAVCVTSAMDTRQLVGILENWSFGAMVL